LQVFIFEYLCATGADLAASLQSEGWAMLSALLQDFGRVPGVQTVTLVEARSPLAPPGQVRRIRQEHEAAVFRELVRESAFTLVIAPEFDGLLETRCRWVEEAGGRLLGPSSSAVRLAGDKFDLARRFHEEGVPTPPCTLLPANAADAVGPYPGPFPAVHKPRFGAGSQATFLVTSQAHLAECIRQARAEGEQDDVLVQPFVPGQAVSVALLLGPHQRVALPPAAQHLSPDGRFRYQGGSLPLPPPLASRATTLAKRATACVPAMRGYVGVDLVLGEADDGRDDAVIEINPRLTTSYVGLRALAQSNLAEALLQSVEDRVEPLEWRPGRVQFAADGSVQCCS
jgi:predicted ATP-grasp superfamily ATP-dependent carboligase